MNECYLCTVWHTGTTYFKQGLEKHYRVAYSHLNDSVISQLPKYQKIYTTYRDPYRVAASWANRGRFSKGRNAEAYSAWNHQWECFRKALRQNPVILDFTKGTNQDGIEFGPIPANQSKDTFRLHEAIDNGAEEELFLYIPRYFIEHAIECSGYLYKEG